MRSWAPLRIGGRSIVGNLCRGDDECGCALKSPNDAEFSNHVGHRRKRERNNICFDKLDLGRQTDMWPTSIKVHAARQKWI